MIILCVTGVIVAQILPHHVGFAEWHAIVVLVCFVILVPVHEALHAVGLRIFAQVQWCHIRFGVMWRGLMPYCHCAVPISIRAYRRMALLPLWVTGSLSIALLLVFAADCFGAFAGFAVAACVGDVWLVCKLRGFADTLLVQDSASEIGCDVFSSMTAIGEPGAVPSGGPAKPAGSLTATEGQPSVSCNVGPTPHIMTNPRAPKIVIGVLVVALCTSFGFLVHAFYTNFMWKLQVDSLARYEGSTRARHDFQSGTLRLYVISGGRNDAKFSGTNDGPFEVWFPQYHPELYAFRYAEETMVTTYNDRMRYMHAHPERYPVGTNTTRQTVRP